MKSIIHFSLKKTTSTLTFFINIKYKTPMFHYYCDLNKKRDCKKQSLLDKIIRFEIILLQFF